MILRPRLPKRLHSSRHPRRRVIPLGPHLLLRDKLIEKPLALIVPHLNLRVPLNLSLLPLRERGLIELLLHDREVEVLGRDGDAGPAAPLRVAQVCMRRPRAPAHQRVREWVYRGWPRRV